MTFEGHAEASASRSYFERLSASTRASLRGALALGSAALDLVFPPICLACRKATAMHHALCPSCWGRMNFIDRPYCERLGTPFPYDLAIEGLQSPEAIANLPRAT